MASTTAASAGGMFCSKNKAEFVVPILLTLIEPTAATIPSMLPTDSAVPLALLPIEPPDTRALWLSIDPLIVRLPLIEPSEAMRPL